MNLEYFIAKRISQKGNEVFSGPVIRVSILSITLGLSVMLISIAIVMGFKNTISSKVTGFSSQLKIVPFDNNQSMEEEAIDIDDELLSKLKNSDNIDHINLTAKKAGVIKTEDQIQGVVFKGLGTNYNPEFLKASMIDGKIPDFKEKNDSVIISSYTSRKLGLKTGDDLRVWFISGENSNPRGRKFKISGIYETSLEEFDSRFILGDIRHIQKLNGWNDNQVGTIELFCKDADNIDETQIKLYKAIPYNLQIISIKQEFPHIFNWLDLLDTNVAVVLVLMVLVAGITMVSTLFIIIMERTVMIGTLKSMGSTNMQIRKIFLYKAANIIGKGMLWGNIAGLALYFIQYYFRIIKLSGESYYVNYVPVDLYLSHYLYLNLGTFLISILILIGPSYYITRISPSKALRYE